MNTASPSIYRHASRIAGLLVSVALLLCVLALLASAGLLPVAHGPQPADAMHLAPFRWEPLAANLA